MSTDQPQNQVSLEQLQSMLRSMQPQQQQATPFQPMLQTQMQPQGFMQQPTASIQPTGVSVPIYLPMPDGTQVHARLELPADALANWPAVAQMLIQAYGEAIPRNQPRNQWQGQQGGYGNGNGYQQRQSFGGNGYRQPYSNGYGQQQRRGGW